MSCTTAVSPAARSRASAKVNSAELAPAIAAQFGDGGHGVQAPDLSPAQASTYQPAEEPRGMNLTEVAPEDHLPPDEGPTSVGEVPEGDPDGDDDPPPSSKKTLIGGYE